MKYLMVIFLVLAAFSAEPVMSAPDQINIKLSVDNCDPDHAETLSMALAENQILIQDLGFGQLILIDRNNGNRETVVPFPETVLSLYFSDTDGVFVLTRTGIAKFALISEAITWLKQANLDESKIVKLQNSDFSHGRIDYRLLVANSGNMAIWNKSESLLQVYDATGKYVDAFPCQNNPILTGQNSFISTYFAPGYGTRIVETGFVRPIENGAQKEVNTLVIELQRGEEFHIVSYNAAEKSFKGILLPPVAENIALDPAIHDKPVADSDSSDKEVSQASVENDPRSGGEMIPEEFCDQANPNALRMLYCRVDSEGAVKSFQAFPAGFFNGKIVEKNDTVFYLNPKYESASDTISLAGFNILQYKISEK